MHLNFRDFTVGWVLKALDSLGVSIVCLIFIPLISNIVSFIHIRCVYIYIYIYMCSCINKLSLFYFVGKLSRSVLWKKPQSGLFFPLLFFQQTWHTCSVNAFELFQWVLQKKFKTLQRQTEYYSKNWSKTMTNVDVEESRLFVFVMSVIFFRGIDIMLNSSLLAFLKSGMCIDFKNVTAVVDKKSHRSSL